MSEEGFSKWGPNCAPLLNSYIGGLTPGPQQVTLLEIETLQMQLVKEVLFGTRMVSYKETCVIINQYSWVSL